MDDSARKLIKSDFEYNEKKNHFSCPGGQVLVMISESGDGSRKYQGDSTICAQCPYQARCCQSTKGAARQQFSLQLTGTAFHT
ncbi:MAG: transposase [Alteromonadaceae bacterium]